MSTPPERDPAPVPLAADGEPGRLDSRLIHDGRIVHLTVDQVRFPDGSIGELERIRHVGASAVLPFLDAPDSPDPTILMVHQYRYAAGGYLYEVPAGLPERPDEPWAECARRELREETGYSAGNVKYLTRIYTTPGFTDEVIHLFAATGLSRGEADRDIDEFMDLVPMRLSKALDMVRTGEIVDCKTVATLLFGAAFVAGKAGSEGGRGRTG